MGAVSNDPPGPDRPHGARRTNPPTLDAYFAVAAGGAEAAVEVLTPAAARGEAVFLALRTDAGLDPGPFADEFGGSPRHFFAPVIDELTVVGLLEEDTAGGLRLTPRGRMLSDCVFERFV
jgi:coproporphyrinogen III oxidase-like Fe-S oxidoreductase